MLAVRARGPGLGVASRLVELLPEAASRDPYLEALEGDGRHCHGYGYVAAVKTSGSWRLVSERFDAHPDLSWDEACEVNLESLRDASRRLAGALGDAEEAAVVVHARRTFEEPRGATGAHPFREEVVLDAGGGSSVLAEVYLAHNGSVDKEGVASGLDLKGPVEAYTDSHIVLKKLAAGLNGSRVNSLTARIAAAIGDVIPHVNSALDLLILIYAPGRDPLLAAAGYVADPGDRARWEYYKPIVVVGEGYSAYLSSTLWDLAGREGVPARESRVIQGLLAVLEPGRARYYRLAGRG